MREVKMRMEGEDEWRKKMRVEGEDEGGGRR